MGTILAIESSCDDTSVAVVRDRTVLGNVVASQIKLHETYGGVVPELASRQHLEMVNPCIDKALEESGLGWDGIDAIASTVTPGLVGSLMVGVMAGKTLAMVHNKPFLGVHHLEGHVFASYLAQPHLKPPFLCLLVSGGHTSLIHVKGCGNYENIGSTRDDAAGEAFDKVARLLNLGYPGGPIIDKLAKEGNPQAFKLPEGRVSLPNNQGFHPYDSSFSGLKTAVLRLVTKLKEEMGEENLPIADLCASFQITVAKALTKRAVRACLDLGLDTIAVGGGVAANSGLRDCLQSACQEHGLTVYFPPLKYCTDNAAMIGCAAAEHFNNQGRSPLNIEVSSRMSIERVGELYLQS
ncbi:N6-L-threonylcarbamoyladenine synthase TsaD [Cyanobacterium sp. HL-69]|uniref:tRNA (adenosine(37)-N6)-threonylcarbamoyltransferase complex transferase subunit TsaD n=1 Tax=Cyanobacterium sp. HL-69 TaxID=2054282 RepID=UPI000CA3B87C|nr:N6-L-threonylcarbamoyladenine synthase TsaD [Cyanobacterium sp. HL-69]